MVYPFLGGPELRKRLIQEQIFVATYWPNIFDWCTPTDREWQLAEQLIPLPIDQRYGPAEMARILDVIAC
jgi:hypothetical protein